MPVALIGCVYPAPEDPIQQVSLVGRSHLPVAESPRIRVDYPEGFQSTLEVAVGSAGAPVLRVLRKVLLVGRLVDRLFHPPRELVD